MRLAAALALVGALLIGCKEHESLVIFALTTSENATELKTVDLTVGPVPGGTAKVTRTFTLSPGGLTTSAPRSFGVYVPSSIVGQGIALAAVATKGTGTGCYSNRAEKEIPAAGATVTVPMTLAPDPNACPITGTGGTGGTTGAAGSGGTTGAAGSAGMTGAGGTAGTIGTAGTVGGGGTVGTAGTTGAAGRGGTTGAAGTTGVAGAMGGRGGTTGAAGAAGGRGGTTGVAGGGGSGGGAGGTRAPAWGGPMVVAGNPAITERFPAVAVDPTGNAVVVYMYAADIWAVRYNAASGTWGTPGAIDGRGGDAGAPVVAVDKDGHYTAVWAQAADSGVQGIWQSTSNDGITWTGPAMITTANGWLPVIAMNQDGAAVVAWTEGVTNGWQAAASTRPSATGAWAAPQVMRPGTDYGDRTPAVGISGVGEAFVGWEQGDGGTANQTSIWMRQHTNAGWTAAMLLETFDLQQSYAISIATNKTGAAIVTWIQVAGNAQTLQLQARRYLPASGFSAVTKVAEGTEIEWYAPPALLLDDAGTATVAWGFYLQGGRFNVFVNRATPTEAWPTPMAMETDNEATDDVDNEVLDSIVDPVLGKDAAGNVTLVWRKRKGTRFDLWSRRLPVGGAWTPETLLETRDTYSVFWPTLAVGANGTAIATWYYGTELDCWANVWR